MEVGRAWKCRAGSNANASQAGAAGLEAAIRLAWIADRQLPFNPPACVPTAPGISLPVISASATEQPASGWPSANSAIPKYERRRHRAKRTREVGWEIHKTASQISRTWQLPVVPTSLA
ncbi:MAG: hypothetical protein WKF77_19385, partial [Planctomycetaceae bacterium]